MPSITYPRAVTRRSAPFETPPAAAPQDRRARLEARKALLQPFFLSAARFLDKFFRRGRLFWTDFLRKLARRGLRVVKLLVSDAMRSSKPRSACSTPLGSKAGTVSAVNPGTCLLSSQGLQTGPHSRT
jgi:hypothetical protein